MSDQPPILDINPPLINSSNPWATTLDDLRALFECASTGAVTTRTSLIKGFDHDPTKHQYTFFGVTDHVTSQTAMASSNASLNTLGYSPILLNEYLGFIKQIYDGNAVPATPNPSKGFIVSVTGTPEEVADCYRLIAISQTGVAFPLAMEVNLSCPNIPSKPPPAYSKDSLVEYIDALSVSIQAMPNLPRVPFGLKTPPYTHSTEFEALIGALEQSARRGISPVSFLTATNTLGSCMAFSSPTEPSGPALPGLGIGGMAGAPLHPLALGNVATLRRMLDDRKQKLGHIRIIGIGGVLDEAGYRRMRAVGASFVGIGTGLGLKGVKIFDEVGKALAGRW